MNQAHVTARLIQNFVFKVLIQLNGANLTTIPDTFRKEQIDFINSDPLVYHHRRALIPRN